MRSKKSLYLTAVALTVALTTAGVKHAAAFENHATINGETYTYDPYTLLGTKDGKTFRYDNITDIRDIYKYRS